MTLPSGLFTLLVFIHLPVRSQISLRMQDVLDCQNSTYQVTLEMKNESNSPIELGNSSLRINYNHAVLTYTSYESLSFDGNTNCGSGSPSEWFDHNIDASSLSGFLGINLSRNPDFQNGCPELASGEWTVLGKITFQLSQPNTDPELSFTLNDNQGIITSSFNSAQPNNGSQSMTISTTSGINREDLNCEPATLKGKLSLQGRSNHSIMLSAWLYAEEDLFRPQYVFSPITASDGSFTLDNISPGSYYIYLKYSNTLSRVEHLTLTAGDNPIEFPALRGGDSNGDNSVNLNDFSLLLGAYNTDSNQPGFNSMADFDLSQRINIIDFTILLSNYNQQGESVFEKNPTQRLANSPPYAIQKETLLKIVPQNASEHFEVGDTLSLDLWVDPLTLSVDGVETHFTYDPEVIELIDTQLGNELELPLLKIESQEEGRVSLAAGTFEGGKLTPFKFGNMKFRAIRKGKAKIDLFEPKAYETTITHLGYSILYQVDIPDFAIHAPKPAHYLQVFPNPSNGKFHLEKPSDLEAGTLRVFDLQGRLLQSHFWCASCDPKREVNLSLPGTYLVKLQSDNQVYSAILQVQ